MGTRASRVAVLILIIAGACGGGLDRKDREITRSCDCAQLDGATSTVSYGPILSCNVTPEDALADCQYMPISDAGCASLGACRCTVQLGGPCGP